MAARADAAAEGADAAGAAAGSAILSEFTEKTDESNEKVAIDVAVANLVGSGELRLHITPASL